MRIILFTNIVRKVSGLSTFDRNFCINLTNEHDITYVYRAGHEGRIKEISKYVKTLKYEDQILETDICIYSSIEHGSPPRIKALKNIQIYHADLKYWFPNYQKPSHIDSHISVSDSVKNSLLTNFQMGSIVIPNMLSVPNNEKVLRLITVSRIEEGKGFDRIIEIAKILRNAGKKFVWEIYGEGAPNYLNDLKYHLTGIHEVVFMGSRLDIQPYIKGCDYLVQLSDNEGFCYSVYEALQVGVPCLVSRCEALQAIIKDGINGYILDMDLQNLDIDRLYNSIPKNVKLKLESPKVKWLEFLNLQ